VGNPWGPLLRRNPDRASLRVLVPGAGLARLPYEVVQRGMPRLFRNRSGFNFSPGYSCQGNEFSHFMLLSSYYILNR
jgi:carnosine N-methyltransferase